MFSQRKQPTQAQSTWGILPIKYKHRHHNTQNRKVVHRRIQSQMYTLQREEQRNTPATGSNVKNTSDSASTHLDRERGEKAKLRNSKGQ